MVLTSMITNQQDAPTCPNCGAPWQAAATGTQVCANCNQVVDNGRFDWVVDQISVNSIDERPPTLYLNARAPRCGALVVSESALASLADRATRTRTTEEAHA